MGLFNWLRNMKSNSKVTVENADADADADAQGNARVKRLAYSAQIKFPYWNSLNELPSNEIQKMTRSMQSLAGHLLKTDPDQLNRRIDLGYKAISWMILNVKDRFSKKIFEGVGIGLSRYDSEINKYLLAEYALAIYFANKDKDIVEIDSILESLANQILMLEDTVRRQELEGKIDT